MLKYHNDFSGPTILGLLPRYNDPKLAARVARVRMKDQNIVFVHSANLGIEATRKPSNAVSMPKIMVSLLSYLLFQSSKCSRFLIAYSIFISSEVLPQYRQSDWQLLENFSLFSIRTKDLAVQKEVSLQPKLECN